LILKLRFLKKNLLICKEIWTPEKIAQSFPITVESCRKLLKSRWAPRTLDELVLHDERAMENWKTLAKVTQTDPGE
jgi:hypothetical protein